MGSLEKLSPCKINLLLNILGKRPDGFHELETVMQPVALCDRLSFEARPGATIGLTCNLRALPTDSTNLVYRAAVAFREAAALPTGVQIHLEKHLPLAAGLGGGSSNAAITLLALNEMAGYPLSPEKLHSLASRLGSDVPFFLQSQPALATGRGEHIRPLPPFPALQDTWVLLVHPGFGVSTAWAYAELAHFPRALPGEKGRADRLLACLRNRPLQGAAGAFYNSLEEPVLHKYPVLALYQEFLREQGAAVALMSGSGSSTFAVFESKQTAENALDGFCRRFGQACWTALVAV
jgi:4-diphosphocytidyl-2-C-methyl-D-erythritol kinase